jgi:CSLREA domain-containing protein
LVLEIEQVQLVEISGRVVDLAQLGITLRQIPLLAVESAATVTDDDLAVALGSLPLSATASLTLPLTPSPSYPWPTPAGSTDLTGDAQVTQADVNEAALAWSVARRQMATCPPAQLSPQAVPAERCFGVADIVDLVLTAKQAAPAAAEANQPSAPSVFTVNTLDDEPDAVPGDERCATLAATCSLRAAILEANVHPGPDTIVFALAGLGPYTIQLQQALPTLSDLTGGTTLDGYTQAGARPNTDPLLSNAAIQVQVRGNDSASFDGLAITSPANIISGLALFQFAHPIYLFGRDAHDNRIVGNFIGTDAAGLVHATMAQEFVGGVGLAQGAHHNQIGSASLAERNVIAGNSWNGVVLYHRGTSANRIQNNLIGLDPQGDKALPNLRHGVDINLGASANLVGGEIRQGNVIAGNGLVGVEISHDVATRANQVRGNFIGTDVTGTGAHAYTANGGVGIDLHDGVSGNTVAGNVIGNNLGGGIVLDGQSTYSNTVRDNRIGLSLDNSAIPHSGTGILIRNGAAYTHIGPGNLVANNGIGVQVSGQGSDFNTITQNSIYGNSGKGIDLDAVGVTLVEEEGDGPNQQLPMPEVILAGPGWISGRGCAGCLVELFQADQRADQYGQGKVYLGLAVADQQGRFAAPVRGLTVGDYVTATATDVQGNTSEFARSRRVEALRLYMPLIMHA